MMKNNDENKKLELEQLYQNSKGYDDQDYIILTSEDIDDLREELNEYIYEIDRQKNIIKFMNLLLIVLLLVIMH